MWFEMASFCDFAMFMMMCFACGYAAYHYTQSLFLAILTGLFYFVGSLLVTSGWEYNDY